MRVLVTGASGFVGAYASAALRAAGHEVKAFVRSEDKLRRAFAPLGVECNDILVGDVTDRAAVAEAVEGCDSVIHTANIYKYDTRFAAEMQRVNLLGTTNVLEAAIASGCDPVIHISSIVALLPYEGEIPSDPVFPKTRSGDPYVDSKKDAEAIARRFQDRGDSVVTVYLGSVWGPHDPGPGEMVTIARVFLHFPIPFGLRGHLGIADAAAVGRLLAGLVEPGRGPRRVVFGGPRLEWNTLGRVIIDAAGARHRPFLPTPYAMAAVTGRTFQAISRATGREFPINAGGPWVVRHWPPTDDSVALGFIGSLPPVEETVAEATRWMVGAGVVKGPQGTGSSRTSS